MFPTCRGWCRRVPRPDTVVILMTRDTCMRTGDAYYVSAGGYCLRVSRTVLRRSPWCHNIVVASQLVVLDVRMALSVLVVAAQLCSAGCSWRPII